MTHDKEKKPSVWVINTHSIGELRAREGIAQAINPDYKTVHLQTLDKEEIRNFCIKTLGTKQLKSSVNWPDFVITSGKRSVDAACALKQLSGGKVFIIQSQSPKAHFEDFGLIAIPGNLTKNKERDMPNLFETIGVPHAVTQAKIDEGVASWEEQFSKLPHPRIAVLLGGKVKRQKDDGDEVEEFDFSAKLAKKMAAELNEKVKALKGALIVTTSPRTGQDVAEAFSTELTVPTFFHDWTHTAARGNPYFGILGLADAIVVTGDSMTMCCEANVSRKPVFIYSPENKDGEMHFRKGHVKLHAALYQAKVARPFSDLLTYGIDPWDYTPLQTNHDIAAEAMKRLKERDRGRAR